MSERFNPYQRFKTNNYVPAWLAKVPGISWNAKGVYARLVRFGGKDGRVFAHRLTIAGEVGLSLGALDDATAELRRHGLIEVERHRGPAHYFFLKHAAMLGHFKGGDDLPEPTKLDDGRVAENDNEELPKTAKQVPDALPLKAKLELAATATLKGVPGRESDLEGNHLRESEESSAVAEDPSAPSAAEAPPAEALASSKYVLSLIPKTLAHQREEPQNVEPAERIEGHGYTRERVKAAARQVKADKYGLVAHALAYPAEIEAQLLLEDEIDEGHRQRVREQLDRRHVDVQSEPDLPPAPAVPAVQAAPRPPPTPRPPPPPIRPRHVPIPVAIDLVADLPVHNCPGCGGRTLSEGMCAVCTGDPASELAFTKRGSSRRVRAS